MHDSILRSFTTFFAFPKFLRTVRYKRGSQQKMAVILQCFALFPMQVSTSEQSVEYATARSEKSKGCQNSTFAPSLCYKNSARISALF